MCVALLGGRGELTDMGIYFCLTVSSVYYYRKERKSDSPNLMKTSLKVAQHPAFIFAQKIL